MDFARIERRATSSSFGRGTVYLVVRQVRGNFIFGSSSSEAKLVAQLPNLLRKQQSEVTFSLDLEKRGAAIEQPTFCEFLFSGIYDNELELCVMDDMHVAASTKVDISDWAVKKSGYRECLDLVNPATSAKVGQLVVTFLCCNTDLAEGPGTLTLLDPLRVVTERTFYQPGDVVRGILSYTNSKGKATKVERLELRMRGGASIDLKGHEELFGLTSASISVIDKPEELVARDIHRWKFSFVLPKDLPRSCGWISPEKVGFQILYGIEATMTFAKEHLLQFRVPSPLVCFKPLSVVDKNKFVARTSPFGLIAGSEKSVHIVGEHMKEPVQIGKDFNVFVTVFNNTKRKIRFDVTATLELTVQFDSLTSSATTPVPENQRYSTERFPVGKSWTVTDCTVQQGDRWRSSVGPFQALRPASAFAPASSLDPLSTASLTTPAGSVWHARASVSWRVRFELKTRIVPGSGEVARREQFEINIPITVVPQFAEAQHMTLEENFAPKLQLSSTRAPVPPPQIHVFRFETAGLLRVDNMYSIDAGLLVCASSSVTAANNGSPLMRLWKDDQTRCFYCEQSQEE